MKKYCISCGTPHEFTFQPPVFCENCGHRFNSQLTETAAVALPAPKKTLPKRRQEVEEEEDDTPLPNIDKLDVTVEGSQRVVVTVESVANAPMLGGNRSEISRKTKEDVKKEFDELFRRDRAAGKDEVSP